ncbi:MAG: CopG family transcriptional regulator [Gammaproteobacteria bacterium]|nr:CopG family transcriptional regulator [Gammaproteobacteria bacterium]MYD75566.1 CopG family transcriptional regulator [Gammaproteobacteria bacterium]MYJ51210.1 CopG family transcriptional regulator [Gammaproteobacteria bacterium]
MAGTRASLSLSTPNAEWIQEQISSGEFSSRSEVVNDLIRRAREIEIVRQRLIAAEQSVDRHGWINKGPEEMLDGFKAKARRDGRL